MRSIHFTGSLASGWSLPAQPIGFAPQLVLWFGARQADGASLQAALQTQFAEAAVVGCSTSGEIVDGEVLDDTLVGTAIEFHHSHIRTATVEQAEATESHAIGVRLAQQLRADDLSGVMLFCDGLRVSGTALGRGFTEVLGEHIPICGALAGDGSRFEKTWVACNAAPASGRIVAIGFYGERLHMRFGTGGGWDPFGPQRQITRSTNNQLFELDGQPALSLYKKYLGDEAAGLPGSALHFPLFVRGGSGDGGVTRTVLAVSEIDESITFAGDLPVGHTAQLMHGNFERMIAGAADSTRAMQANVDAPEGLVLLMSCVGRKLVLGERVSEEVTAALEYLPKGMPVIGFYSYGGLAPVSGLDGTQLHNQTMTAVLITETA